MLTLEVAAEVPGLEDYYVDIGLCQPGEPYRMAWTWDSLSRKANGTYDGTLTFPLDLDMGLELRLEDNTVLFSSDFVSDLLPLQFGQGGPSIHFNSEEQKLYLCDFDVHLVNLAGGETQGRDGKTAYYDTVRPVTKEFRAALTEAVVTAYTAEVEKLQSRAASLAKPSISQQLAEGTKQAAKENAERPAPAKSSKARAER